MSVTIASPLNSAIYGIIFWVILYVFSPVSYGYPLSFYSISLLISSYILFFSGYFIGNNVKTLKMPLGRSREKKGMFHVFLFVSITSVLFIIIDKFVLRGIGIGNGAFENREILENSPPTMIGILGNIMKAAVFMTLFLYYKLNIKDKSLMILTYSLLGYFILESFLMGSRSVPVFYIVLTVLILLHFNKIKIKLRYIFLLSILGIIFFIFLTEIYISRTIEFMETRERAIEFILLHGSYMDYTILDQDFIKFVFSIDSYYIQSFFVGLASFLVYYLHSVVEFSYMIDHFTAPAQLGSHTFFIFAKFFKLIFGLYDGRSLDYIPRLGKYTTFFGDLYMDFKGYLLVFVFLFGFWQARLYKSAKNYNNFSIIPLILFLCMLNFIMPVFNLISGGNGIYLIVGFIVMTYFYRIMANFKIT